MTLFQKRQQLVRLLTAATRDGVLRWHRAEPPDWLFDVRAGGFSFYRATYPQAEHPWPLGILARSSIPTTFSYMWARLFPHERERAPLVGPSDFRDEGEPDIVLVLFAPDERRVADLLNGDDVLSQTLASLHGAIIEQAMIAQQPIN